MKGNKRRYRGKKPVNKEERSDQRVDREVEEVKGSQPNDWRWYAQNEQLIRDYASYPFGTPLGNLIQSGNKNISSGSIPGLMSITFAPTIGVADSENSPINVAMRRLYSYVRHANSGASNYDAPDLMLYMIAVDSAVMFHSELKRLYGVMRDYTPFNRYYPRALCQAMFFDPDDIEVHLNDLRGYINQYAVKLSQLWVPNSMSYIARHSWMCEGIYVDSVSSKAQSYMYVPRSFYRFKLDEDGAGMCEVASFGAPLNLQTFDQLVTFGNSLLNPMIANEDFGIMSGDILKAFGAGGVIQIPPIGEDYQVIPVYNQEVLSQIENTVFGSVGNNAVTQMKAVGTGWLKSAPNITITIPVQSQVTNQTNANSIVDTVLSAYQGGNFLSMHSDNIEPAQVMVATRNMWAAGQRTNNATMSATTVTGVAPLVCCGSEVFSSAYMYYYVKDSANGVKLQYNSLNMAQPVLIKSTTPDAGLKSLTLLTAQLSAFDWHPGVFMYPIIGGVDGENAVILANGVLRDLDYYTVLDENSLANMHMTALLSEFSIPMIG